MAKSLRSKWKRKMKAVKRVRYGEKELSVLKKTLKSTTTKKMRLKKIVAVVYPKRFKNRREKESDSEDAVKKPEGGMEVDKVEEPIYNASLRDANGNFPPWLHRRKQRKITGKTQGKKGKKKGASTW